MNAHDLIRRREALPLTRDELGRLLGVSEDTIGLWENRYEHPRYPKMLDLALEAIEKRKTWIDLTDAMYCGKGGGDG